LRGDVHLDNAIKHLQNLKINCLSIYSSVFTAIGVATFVVHERNDIEVHLINLNFLKLLSVNHPQFEAGVIEHTVSIKLLPASHNECLICKIIAPKLMSFFLNDQC